MEIQNAHSDIRSIVGGHLWRPHVVASSNSQRQLMEGWKACFFRTPGMGAKMNPVNPDVYWWNCGAHHTQILWTCPIVGPFWDYVFAALNTKFHQSLPKDLKLAIQGSIPESTGKKNNILNILLTAETNCIIIKWLKSDTSIMTWTEKVREICQVEQFT